MQIKHKLFFLFFLLFSTSLIAQKRVTMSGYIKDASSGEDLIYANIYDQKNTLDGVTSNNYGFFSLSLKPGVYTIIASYIGYEDKEITINFTQDTTFNIEMSSGALFDSVIVVTDKRGNNNVESTQMGTIELEMSDIKKLPAFMGEVDLLKIIQLLPGVQSAGEGTAGFFVRGGGIDQNLVLLDEAVVYNAGHLLGFFSVFNSDAIKKATLIKGGMPANYGGRLSSVLDIQMKDGYDDKFGIEGGIGIISSRLTIQGPIVPKKGSFIISGRRTYAFEAAQPFIKGTAFEGTNYYFYDLNIKAKYQITDRDRIFLSGYFGRDVLNLKNPDRGFVFNMPYGNATATLRWNHIFDDKLFMNFVFVYNDYDFSVSGGQEQFSFKLNSGIRDFGGKVSFDYYPSPRHQIKFGTDYTYHTFTPNRAEAFSGAEAFIIDPERKHSHEAGLYITDNWKISKIFSVNVGLRFSMFQQVGPYTGKVDTTRTYGRLEPVKTYYGVEPRFSGKATVSPFSSIKAGVTLGRQYVHLVSNSTSTLPTDLWVPSTETVRPQWGLQYALGYFHNFFNNTFEASIEVFYKDMFNQLDYSENYTPTPDADLEDQFISGSGRAYGLELFVRKQKGRFTGWIAYTLSRSERTFDNIRGKTFLAGFDRTHDLSVVLSYDIFDWFTISSTFVYGSGAPYTPIKSVYIVNFSPTLEYGLRNSARLPAYHRMDLSLAFRLTKKEKPFQADMVLSVYNIYNRQNIFFTYTAPETDALSGQIELRSYQVSLFPIIPTITLNFKWKQPKKGYYKEQRVNRQAKRAAKKIG
ncbi:MAG: TonB-dependent receptor [Aureispira sp.]|nr:TonB-dependent receptor [Aureispira sp.]